MTNELCFTGNVTKCDQVSVSLNQPAELVELTQKSQAFVHTSEQNSATTDRPLNEASSIAERNQAESEELTDGESKLMQATKIDILTLYPEMFSALSAGIMQRARESGLVVVNVHNIRDYTTDKHGKCDDYAFGGGAGMVMTPQPIADAVRSVDPDHKALRIYMSPRGKTLDQETVCELAREKSLLFLCGHYEGVDQRVIDGFIDREISIGDYVLMGGELPAMVTVEALSRYIPGVLHSQESTKEESFVDSLLEYPQYTRPAVFEGVSVPEVLLSGHHGNVEKWRFEQRVAITKERRPDLYEKANIPQEKPKRKKRRSKAMLVESEVKSEGAGDLNQTNETSSEGAVCLNQTKDESSKNASLFSQSNSLLNEDVGLFNQSESSSNENASLLNEIGNLSSENK